MLVTDKYQALTACIISGVGVVITIVVGISSISNAMQAFAWIDTKVITDNLEVILLSSTVMIAFLSLWLTNLKGPDIDLLKMSEVAYGEVTDQPSDVPDHIRFRPLRLVFANHGSRDGLISEIRVKLETADWLEPYYQTVMYSIQPRGAQQMDLYDTEQALGPISILHGQSILVNLPFDIITKNWKDYPAELPESMQIGEAIRRSINKNREVFAAFVKELANKQPIGTINITAMLTTRKWTFQNEFKERTIVTNVLIPAVPSDWTSTFERSMERWDNLSPSFGDVITRALQDINNLRNRLQQRLPLIPTALSENLQPFPKSEISQWFRLDTAYPYLTSLRNAFLGRDKELESALRELEEAAENFNFEVARYNLRKDQGKADIKPVQESADKLQPIVDKSIKLLARLGDTVAEAA